MMTDPGMHPGALTFVCHLDVLPFSHFFFFLGFLQRCTMSLTLENFVISHPAVTLAHTDYGQHFHVGRGVNILTAPSQRLRSFVENDGSPDGSPYRFIVAGQLASFKIVEDSVGGSLPPPSSSPLPSLMFLVAKFGHFLSVSLGLAQSSAVFSEIFRRQLATLQKIEEEDGSIEGMHAQVGLFFFLGFSLRYSRRDGHRCSTHTGDPREATLSLRLSTR
jgi:hypothetical protein